jgi:hypothetical protein
MSVEDELYALINDAVVVPYALSARNSVLGEVTGVPTPTMTITGITGKGFTGEGTVIYDKMRIDELITDDLVVRSRTTLSNEAFIALVNATFSLYMTVDDLESFVLPEYSQDTEFNITLTAKGESLGWYGTAVVRFAYGTPLLSSAVYNRILSVMKHPAGFTNISSRSGRAITYNLDLTVFRDELTSIASNQRWVSLTKLNQYLMSQFGLSINNNVGVVVRSTAEVAGSNPDYDYVIVYNGSVSGGYGPLYLHWNDLEGRADG